MANLTEMDVEIARIHYTELLQKVFSQLDNPLRDTFTEFPLSGREQDSWEEMGTRTLSQRTGDFDPVTRGQPDLKRLWIGWKGYYDAIGISENQIMKARDLRPEFFGEQQRAATEQEIKDQISAFEEPMKIGKNGTSTDSFDTTAMSGFNSIGSGHVIPADFENSGTDQDFNKNTLEALKMLAIRRKFPPSDPMYFLGSEYEQRSLENIDEFKNNNYAVTQRYENGPMTRFNWRGITWVFLSSEFLPTGTRNGTVRHCYFWTKSSMRIGFVKELDTRMDDIGAETQANRAWQLKLNHDFGVSRGRTNSAGVFRVETKAA